MRLCYDLRGGCGRYGLCHRPGGSERPPFKLGTFEQNGRTFVGIVLKDSVVIDFAQASAALSPTLEGCSAEDMKDLIARYDAGACFDQRDPQATKSFQGHRHPAFVHDLKSVRTLPPIVYPTTMLNVAVNYRAHGAGDGGRSAEGGAPAPGDALPGTTSAPESGSARPTTSDGIPTCS